MKTPEEEKEMTALRALATDISEAAEHVKKSDSNANRAAYSAFIQDSCFWKKTVSQSRAKRSLSKLVHLDRRCVSQAIQDRSKTLAGEKKSWLHTERKTRGVMPSVRMSNSLYSTFGFTKPADPQVIERHGEESD